jgi:DNA-binding XRE family transcriptional regulator
LYVVKDLQCGPDGVLAVSRKIDDNLEPPWELERRRIIARKFKQMRQNYRLTQEELAIAADVHKNTVSNAERYGKIPTEEFYRYQQIAKRAHMKKSLGAVVSKITLSDIPFSDFRRFLTTFWE